MIGVIQPARYRVVLARPRPVVEASARPTRSPMPELVLFESDLVLFEPDLVLFEPDLVLFEPCVVRARRRFVVQARPRFVVHARPRFGVLGLAARTPAGDTRNASQNADLAPTKPTCDR